MLKEEKNNLIINSLIKLLEEKTNKKIFLEEISWQIPTDFLTWVVNSYSIQSGNGFHFGEFGVNIIEKDKKEILSKLKSLISSNPKMLREFEDLKGYVEVFVRNAKTAKDGETYIDYDGKRYSNKNTDIVIKAFLKDRYISSIKHTSDRSKEEWKKEAEETLKVVKYLFDTKNMRKETHILFIKLAQEHIKNKTFESKDYIDAFANLYNSKPSLPNYKDALKAALKFNPRANEQVRFLKGITFKTDMESSNPYYNLDLSQVEESKRVPLLKAINDVRNILRVDVAFKNKPAQSVNTLVNQISKKYGEDKDPAFDEYNKGLFSVITDAVKKYVVLKPLKNI